MGAVRKPVFDEVRAQMGGVMKAEWVPILDDALDRIGFPKDGQSVGSKGVAIIRQFEGCAKLRPDGRFEAYPDPGTGGDPWTIGWGATGPGIKKGTIWTQQQCDDRLLTDLQRFAAEVANAIGNTPTTQNQFDALVSFHYNTGAIARATLTKLHKAGDYAGAKAEFAKWVNAGGRVMPGLVRRRAAEAKLYGEVA